MKNKLQVFSCLLIYFFGKILSVKHEPINVFNDGSIKKKIIHVASNQCIFRNYIRNKMNEKKINIFLLITINVSDIKQKKKYTVINKITDEKIIK